MLYGLIIALLLLSLMALSAWRLCLPRLKLDRRLDSAEKTARLEQWLQTLNHHRKFNGVVLLGRGDQIIYQAALGHNFDSAQSPLSLQSSFNLASVSKQFTAYAIMLLRQRGKLQLDDSISTYLPELECYRAVTIRHLLQHLSGLPDYMRLASQHLDDKQLLSFEKLLALYQQLQAPLEFTPGSRFRYSNCGYVFLAEIITRTARQDFAQFMQEQVFEPLGMHNSQVFNLQSQQPPAHRVYGFKPRFGLFGGTPKLSDLNHFDGIAGDGGIYASAEDLWRWHQALQSGELLPLEQYQLAYQPALLNNGKTSHYGFGWVLNRDGSVEHAGGWQGFASYIYRHPKHDEVIIILDNSSNILRAGPFGFKCNSMGKKLREFLRYF